MKKIFAIVFLFIACAHANSTYRDRYHAGDYVRSSNNALYKIEAISGDILRLKFLPTGETVFVNRDSITLEFITDDQNEYESIMVFL